MFGREKRAQPQQPLIAPTTCCMVVGEADEDGWRPMCGAPVARVWYQEQSAYEDVTAPDRQRLATAAAALAFCDEHQQAWQAAQGFEGTREAFPAGEIARLKREAQEQAQELVDTIMAAMAQQLHDLFGATPEQAQGVYDAIRHAVEAEQQRVFKPVSTPAKRPHKPVLLA